MAAILSGLRRWPPHSKPSKAEAVLVFHHTVYNRAAVFF